MKAIFLLFVIIAWNQVFDVLFFHAMQHCFAIMYRRENQRQYELRAETSSECQAWIDGIKAAR